MNKYKEISGTSYKIETPQEVINILEQSRLNKTKIRVFYGDRATGRDWMETYDIQGHIGRSTGEIKIPLLIAKKSSHGGGGLLDNSIVKITIDKKTVYQHPSYTLARLTVKEISKDSQLFSKGYTHSVYADDVNTGNFNSIEKAQNFIAFLEGDRNRM